MHLIVFCFLSKIHLSGKGCYLIWVIVSEFAQILFALHLDMLTALGEFLNVCSWFFFNATFFILDPLNMLKMSVVFAPCV